MATLENIATTTQTFTSFDAFAAHEQDLINVLDKKGHAGSGREWFGEELRSGQSLAIDFETSNISPGTDAQLIAGVVGNG